MLVFLSVHLSCIHWQWNRKLIFRAQNLRIFVLSITQPESKKLCLADHSGPQVDIPHPHATTGPFNIFWRHVWLSQLGRSPIDIYWIKARDAAKYSIMIKTAPPRQIIFQPKMSVVLKLINSVLVYFYISLIRTLISWGLKIYLYSFPNGSNSSAFPWPYLEQSSKKCPGFVI